MVRTQIYLTEAERDGLAAAARATGRKQSELVREALDRWLEAAHGDRLAATLDAVAGMWRDRDDLPDFGEIRRSLDRA